MFDRPQWARAPRRDVPASAAGYAGGMAREPLVDGHGRRIARPAPVGHRPLQLPLPVLHAGGGAAVARARRRPAASRRSSASWRCWPRWASARVRLTGGEPLVRRDFPRLAAMLAARRRRGPRVTTNGYLLERDAAALVDAGVNRFNVSIDSLQRDRFFAHDPARRAAAGPARPRGARALPEAHPIKVNAVALRGFTEHEVLPFAALRARAPLRGALHRVHAARRRPLVDAASRC